MATTAKDIMSTQVTVARDDMSVEEAVQLLVCKHITGMPVVNAKGQMVGVLSEYDIIVDAAHAKHFSRSYLKQKITFSRKVDAVFEDTPLRDIVRRFVKHKFRRLPVLDKGNRIVGIISRRDVIRLIYYRAKVAKK